MIRKLLGAALNLNAWTVAALAGLAVSLATCDRVRIKSAEQRGAATVTTELNTQAKEIADAAKQSRADAARPGAAERLRKREHCRDC